MYSLFRSWLTSGAVRALVHFIFITVSAYFGVVFVSLAFLYLSDYSIRIAAAEAFPLFPLLLLATAWFTYAFFLLANMRRSLDNEP